MLQTCAKCGVQFYGAGCPECDYPPIPAAPRERKRTRRWGCAFMGAGLGVILVRILCPDENPLWPVVVAGLLFLLTGWAIVVEPKGRLASALGGVICAGLACLGFYAALAPGEIGGGIPLLPEAWNQVMGRMAFGGGACLTTAFSLWLFYRAWKLRRAKG